MGPAFELTAAAALLGAGGVGIRTLMHRAARRPPRCRPLVREAPRASHLSSPIPLTPRALSAAAAVPPRA